MRVLFTLIFITGSSVAFSQTFYAVANGSWSAASTWSNTQGGAPGAGVPGAGSTVFTDGFSVTVDQNATIANLNIRFNVANSIVHDGTPTVYTLTITNGISGADASSALTPPTVSIIQNTPNIIFRFTGTSSQGAIRVWSHEAPINTVHIDGGSGNITTNGTFGRLGILGTLRLVSGTFTPKKAVKDLSGSSVLIVEAGAVLNLNNASIIGSVDANSVFNEVRISGTAYARDNRFLNADQFYLNSGATLFATFNGPDQTQGWWYRNNAPSFISIDNNSNVFYDANADQSVYAAAYGNLTLNGVGTKNIVGPGTLSVSGLFYVYDPLTALTSSNSSPQFFSGDMIVNGTWSPTNLIVLQGGALQTLSGSGANPYNFNGGLQVNKTAGSTARLARNININSDFTISQGTFHLRTFTCFVNGGNIVNNGIVTALSTGGRIQIDGNTTLTGTGTSDLLHLTVSASGNLEVSSSFSLRGDLINNGILDFDPGVTLTFVGGIVQDITGNGFSIDNIAVNKTNTVRNNTTITLSRLLTMIGGTFDADGLGSGVFILDSNAGGDARIGPMSGGAFISGNVTFRRYFSNEENRWRHLAIPVTGITKGILRSQFTSNSNSIAIYNENTLGDRDQGWENAPSGTLFNRRGYAAYMYDLIPVTISLTGPLFKNSSSTHNYNLTYTDDPAQPASEDGWNFVANPYASPISWNSSSGWSRNGSVDAAASIWDANSLTYRYSNLDWDGVVAQGQSFWIHTVGSEPTVTSDENVKVTNTDPTFYRRGREVALKDRLLVGLENDSLRDIALIAYRPDASVEHDRELDAYKLNNPIFNLSSLTPTNQSLAVNTLPKSFCTNRVRLNVTNIVPGSYRLVFDGVKSFQDLDSLVLFDHYTQQSVKIGEGQTYSFEVTTAITSFGASRFELGFAFNNISSLTATPEVIQRGRTLVSNIPSGNQWYFNGQPMYSETANVLLPARPGEYKVVVSDGVCLEESPSFQLARIPSRVFPNPAREMFNVDVTGILENLPQETGLIIVYNVQGQLILQASFGRGEEIKSIQLNNVMSGEYIVNITVGDSGIVLKERLLVR